MSNNLMVIKNLGNLIVGEVFVYYDEPVVFSLSKDENLFLCMLVNDEPYEWLMCDLNENELQELKIGLSDLRSVFLCKRSLKIISKSNNELVSTDTNISDVPKIYFPDPGFYFTSNEQINANALVRSNSVTFHLLSDLTLNHSIRLDFLTNMANGIKSLLNESSKNFETSKKYPQYADRFNVCFAPGSVKIKVEPIASPIQMNNDQSLYLPELKENMILNQVYNAMKFLLDWNVDEEIDFESAQEKINSRICDAILELNTVCNEGSYVLETIFECEKSDGGSFNRRVVFDDSTFKKTAIARDIMLEQENYVDLCVYGKVITLSFDQEKKSPQRMIVVKGFSNNSSDRSSRQYQIPVDLNCYDKAWKANRDDHRVVVKGKVDTSDKNYKFVDVYSFDIIEDIDQIDLIDTE